jgi:PAS domain S-box-containing protein
MLWSVDVENRKILQISSACKKIYGYSTEDFSSNINLWKDVIHPNDLKLIEKNKEYLRLGETIINRYRIKHKDGSTRFVEVKITPTLSQAGKVAFLHGIARDITKEKKSANALMESELLFRQFFENANEGILIMDVETGRICDYNKSALELLGTSGTEILQKTPTDLSAKYQADGRLSKHAVTEIIKKAIEGENLFFEWLFLNSSGTEIPCEVRLSLIKNQDRLLLRGSIVNITERIQAKQKLEDQQNFYSSLIANINDGIAIIGNHGRLIYQSPSADKISGFTYEEVKDKTIFELVHPDDLADLTITFKEISARPGIPHNRQFRFVHKDGHYVWIEGTITNMLHDKSINGFIANYRNIEERKKTEAQITELNTTLEKKVQERTIELLDANKELEAFSYTVSHDLQAPLRSTCGFAKILLTDYKDKLDDEGKQFLQIISDSSTRMSQLIRDLLAFSKLGKADLIKKEINMLEVIQVVLDEMRFTFSDKSFKFVTHSIANALGDLHLIKQVWFNLISNAIKYSSKKETPLIEIGCLHQNNQTVYYVKDNGAGFDMKYATKLFGVFKRLHNNEDFEGTGVGLATVHRIITRHGGRIWAEAKPGEGATFFFTLPE